MLLFTLSMPNVGSWNGKWTGEDNVYARSFKRTNKIEKELDGKSFCYDFGDGWTARISVQKVLSKDAKKIMKNSKGFAGYDWMISSIFEHGEIVWEKELGHN